MEDMHGVENPPTSPATKLKTMNYGKTQFDEENSQGSYSLRNVSHRSIFKWMKLRVQFFFIPHPFVEKQ